MNRWWQIHRSWSYINIIRRASSTTACSIQDPDIYELRKNNLSQGSDHLDAGSPSLNVVVIWELLGLGSCRIWSIDCRFCWKQVYFCGTRALISCPKARKHVQQLLQVDRSSSSRNVQIESYMSSMISETAPWSWSSLVVYIRMHVAADRQEEAKESYARLIRRATGRRGDQQ
jgi:hypothetical protein